MREIQKRTVQFQTVRSGGVEFDDAEPLARIITDGGAAAAAIRNAIKASGVIVHVDPVEFSNILRKIDQPLIVYSAPRMFSRRHQYLTSYKGLAFFTRSPEQIELPRNVEVIIAKSLWMPGQIAVLKLN